MEKTEADKKIRLIVRADDFGMTHSCNIAVKKCFEEGLLKCASIQAPAPWSREAAIYAVEHPEFCFGVHMTVIAEWVGYRWRPVLPYDQVSTIVDEEGFLNQTVQGFYSREIDYSQLERELLAQVELVRRWGVKPSYIDCHYIDGTNVNDKKYCEVIENVIVRSGLPRSQYMGEKSVRGVYSVEIDKKEDVLYEQINALTPGLWLLCHHLLSDGPESEALVFANPDDYMGGGVANHRIAEFNALLSPRIRKLIMDKGIELVNYKNL